MSACSRLASVQVNAKNEMVANLEVTSELIKNAADLGHNSYRSRYVWHFWARHGRLAAKIGARR